MTAETAGTTTTTVTDRLAGRPVWQVCYLAGLTACIPVEAYVLVRDRPDRPVLQGVRAHLPPDALTLLAMSLAVPLTAADTATSTKLMLTGAHLIAAAVIIPTVARRLRGVRALMVAPGTRRSRVNPGQTVVIRAIAESRNPTQMTRHNRLGTPDRRA